MHSKYLFKALGSLFRFLLNISMFIQGGGYMLILKPNQYDILINIGAFRGLKVSYDIAPGGLYHIKLNSADWSTFQVNLGATGTVLTCRLVFLYLCLDN